MNKFAYNSSCTLYHLWTYHLYPKLRKSDSPMIQFLLWMKFAYHIIHRILNAMIRNLCLPKTGIVYSMTTNILYNEEKLTCLFWIKKLIKNHPILSLYGFFIFMNSYDEKTSRTVWWRLAETIARDYDDSILALWKKCINQKSYIHI